MRARSNKDKIVDPLPGRTITKRYEFRKGHFETQRLYLTHFARIDEIEYEPIRMEVANEIRIRSAR